MASRGTGGAAKKGAAARKRVADRTTSDSVVEEYAESVIVVRPARSFGLPCRRLRRKPASSSPAPRPLDVSAL